MHSDDSPPPPSASSGPPPLDPALEARITAWVLGAASPEEAAELARVCADQAEAEAFRRRFAETHGLLTEAVRPAPADLRLAPERRAKLLALLNQSASAATASELPPAAVFPAAPARRWTAWALPAAASVALLGLLAAIVIPTVGTVSEVASRPFGIIVHSEMVDPDQRQKKVVESSLTPADGFQPAASPSPVFSPPPSPPPFANEAAVSFQLDGAQLGSGAGFGTDRESVRTGAKDARRLEAIAPEIRYRRAIRNASEAKEKSDFVYRDQSNSTATVVHSDPFDPRGAFAGERRQDADLAKNSATVVFKPAAPVEKPEWDAPTDALAARGRSQYAAGAFDEAQETFRTMEATSADNAEARYFLGRIADDKTRTGTLNGEGNRSPLVAEVSKAWQRPASANQKPAEKNVAAPVASAPVETKDAAIRRALDNTIIPELSFRGVSLDQALSALSGSAEEYDGGSGLNIVLDLPPGTPPPPVNISLRRLSLGRILDIITESIGYRYEIRDGTVVVLPPEADAPKPAPRPAPDASQRLETASSDNAVSTFSLHVSDASFRLARAALARGEFPDPAAVRPEEFYNAFDYGDPAPRAGEPVAARVEQAAHPFLQQRNLLRVALRVPATGRAAGQPLRLTLLLDTSGSMEREDRSATVRAALEQLATLLGPADRVTLLGFARTPRLLAERLPGDQAASLAKIAAETPPDGGTNLEAALALAADLALRQFDPAAQNRVVLLTDGAANLGDADPAALSTRVVALRRQGIAFDACGIGADGLDDGVLEALTRQGDGRYLLLDHAAEAGPAFARQLAGAFRPAAQNVKVQIRFNPSRVPRYRLIGFEQHRLREQDFRDDKIDAAELAAAEVAVALYQVEVDPQGSGELGEVFVRFRETATGRMIERSWPLPYDAAAPAFDLASPSLQLAGASALLAEKLRGGDLAAQIRLTDLDPVAAALRGAYAGQPRVAEFLDMLAQARRLAPE